MKKNSTNPGQGATSSAGELAARKREGKPGITVLADEDIRRDLEQRALRNTRSLVDSLEREAEQDRQIQSAATKVIVAVFIVGAIVLALVLSAPGKAPSPPQVLTFPKPAQQAPGK
jgi:hypothetical protein